MSDANDTPALALALAAPYDPDALFSRLSTPIAFVDLETTGGNAMHDRITEIGVVEVGPSGIDAWSTLVDPQQSIPEAIQHLTGISNEMVRGQPTFASLAEALAERLEGKLFVAHNARFDHGFLKNEFRRVGIAFRPDVLCTVRLSRALFPSVHRHGLDALIARLGLEPKGRHRALADADLLWQFWQRIHALYSVELVDTAVKSLIRRGSLPPGLSEDALDAIPNTPGVYLFYGDDDTPLYVGKSIQLRQRVRSHFSGDYRVAKDLRLSQQIRRVDWRETGGEIGALLLEAKLVKDLAPVHNRLLRPARSLCAWHLPDGADTPELVYARNADFGRHENLYGLFQSKARAENRLRKIADEFDLCHGLLGLEKTGAGRPCFGYQTRRCKGACVGAESRDSHRLRMVLALSPLRVRAWPFAGPVGLIERDADSGDSRWHVIDNWAYLGTVRTRDELPALFAEAPPWAGFDHDTYQILARRLSAADAEIDDFGQYRTFRLTTPASAPLAARPARTARRARAPRSEPEPACPPGQLRLALD